MTREGLTTGDNNRFIRLWWESPRNRVFWPGSDTREMILNRKWFAYLKGGPERSWFGNLDYVVDWESDGMRQRLNVDKETKRIRSHNYNGKWAFVPCITWTGISSGAFRGRMADEGFMFDAKGPVAFPTGGMSRLDLLSLLNSATVATMLRVLSPTLDFKLGHIGRVPLPSTDMEDAEVSRYRIKSVVTVSSLDWNSVETSGGFLENALVASAWRLRE